MPTEIRFSFVAFQIFVAVFAVTCLAEIVLVADALARGFKGAKSVREAFASCRREIRASPNLKIAEKIQILAVICAAAATVLLVVS